MPPPFSPGTNDDESEFITLKFERASLGSLTSGEGPSGSKGKGISVQIDPKDLAGTGSLLHSGGYTPVSLINGRHGQSNGNGNGEGGVNGVDGMDGVDYGNEGFFYEGAKGGMVIRAGNELGERYMRENMARYRADLAQAPEGIVQMEQMGTKQMEQVEEMILREEAENGVSMQQDQGNSREEEELEETVEGEGEEEQEKRERRAEDVGLDYTSAYAAHGATDKYYKGFLIKLFEFGKAAESGIDVIAKWEAVRALDPIAISASLRSQTKNKAASAPATAAAPTQAQVNHHFGGTVNAAANGTQEPAFGRPIVQNGPTDGYKRDMNGNVIGRVKGLPASRKAAAAGVNGKTSATSNGQTPAQRPNGIAPTPSSHFSPAAQNTSPHPGSTTIPTPLAPYRPPSPNGSSSKGPLWGQDLSTSPERLALWRAHVARMPPSSSVYKFNLPGITFPQHDSSLVQSAQDWMERLRVRVNDMRNIFTSKRAMHLLTLVGGDDEDARNCLGLTTTKGDKVLLETRQVLIHGRMALLSLGDENRADDGEGGIGGRVELVRDVLEFDKKGRLVGRVGAEVDSSWGFPSPNNDAKNGGGAKGGKTKDVDGSLKPGMVRFGSGLIGPDGRQAPTRKYLCSVGIMRVQTGHPIVFTLHHRSKMAKAYPVSGHRDEEVKAVKALRYMVEHGHCTGGYAPYKPTDPKWQYEAVLLMTPERPEDGHTLTTHILQNAIVQAGAHESGLDPKQYNIPERDDRQLPSRQAAWLAWQQTGLRVANFEALKIESDRLGILST